MVVVSTVAYCFISHTYLVRIVSNSISHEYSCYAIVYKNMWCRAFPIAEALGLGADIVVTGRCVDSALALAPFIHEVRHYILLNHH